MFRNVYIDFLMEIDTSFLQYNYPCNIEEEKHKKRKILGLSRGMNPGQRKWDAL